MVSASRELSADQDETSWVRSLLGFRALPRSCYFVPLTINASRGQWTEPSDFVDRPKYSIISLSIFFCAVASSFSYATATRPETQKWCLDLGAHAVIEHGKPMKAQIEQLRVPPVALVASLTYTDQHYKSIAELMAPQGKFGLIDDPPEFTMSAFKGKAISVHWESMFTRSSFQTPDMIGQHHLLNDVADLIDKGVLRTTLEQTFGTINAANLKRAHALLESGKSRGKIVLEGW